VPDHTCENAYEAHCYHNQDNSNTAKVENGSKRREKNDDQSVIKNTKWNPQNVLKLLLNGQRFVLF